MDKHVLEVLEWGLGYACINVGAFGLGYLYGRHRAAKRYKAALVEAVNMKASEVADAVLEKIGANHANAGTERP